ncbi:MAG: HIT domain-containing protein [Oscillospiraceae bacterium]|nr:HIT domain-containing protein [Oscillospiraceae bacterium]MDD4367722.1 HIT domain-containing protein [Oscillospiraceae bacterium]
MQDCIFCRIAEGQVPSQKILENERVVAFKDLNPLAPVHILVVPRHHYADALELAAAAGGPDPVAAADARKDLVALLEAVRILADEYGLNQPDRGFRLINNCGPQAGQSVQHLHIHLLGGRQLPDKLV